MSRDKYSKTPKILVLLELRGERMTWIQAAKRAGVDLVPCLNIEELSVEILQNPPDALLLPLGKNELRSVLYCHAIVAKEGKRKPKIYLINRGSRSITSETKAAFIGADHFLPNRSPSQLLSAINNTLGPLENHRIGVKLKQTPQEITQTLAKETSEKKFLEIEINEDLIGSSSTSNSDILIHVSEDSEDLKSHDIPINFSDDPEQLDSHDVPINFSDSDLEESDTFDSVDVPITISSETADDILLWSDDFPIVEVDEARISQQHLPAMGSPSPDKELSARLSYLLEIAKFTDYFSMFDLPQDSPLESIQFVIQERLEQLNPARFSPAFVQQHVTALSELREIYLDAWHTLSAPRTRAAHIAALRPKSTKRPSR